MWEYIFPFRRVGGTYAQKLENKRIRNEIAPQVGAVKLLRKNPAFKADRLPANSSREGPLHDRGQPPLDGPVA